MPINDRQESTKAIQGSLSKDWSFIFQGLERLSRGTCCGSSEKDTCSWDLLPKIHEALQDHISFEEKWLFPKLARAERERHQAEHDKLQRLLALASWELECGYGDQFRALSQELMQALSEHREHVLGLSLGASFFSNEECILDDSLQRIRERVLQVS